MVCIAVLQPGAGYNVNRNMYTYLEKIGHTIRLIGDTTDTYNGYDKYPKRWKDDINTWGRTGPNLCTLAHELIEHKALDNIDILICGSRGGQVTLHELWNIGWRGRTINLNAPAMVPSRDIPANAALVLVSLGADYFPTPDHTHVQKLGRKYPGIIDHFHATDEPHMPNTGQLIRGISAIVMVTMTHPHPNPNPMQCRGTDTHTRERQEMEEDIIDTVLDARDEDTFNKAASEARALLDEQGQQELEQKGKQRVRDTYGRRRHHSSTSTPANSLCHWQSALNGIDKESNIRKQLISEPYCLKAREWQKIDEVLSQGMKDVECEDGKQKLRNILKERQCFVPLDPSTPWVFT